VAESPPTTPASSATNPRGFVFAAALLLILATIAAYHGSLSVPFIYDDLPAIFSNPSIMDLRKFPGALSPPADITPSGRPLVNLSLAINYAIGGTEVRSYHVFNLGIHLAAALAFFGVVRRTLLQATPLLRFRESALPLAFATATLWALHPLQTQSVTYVIQRAESLVGLFYFLTLYCFVRGAKTFASRAWLAGAVLACAAGMASKEVMVSAPLIVLLYDRTFVSGSFREAWQSRKLFYVGLAMTWLLLAFCVMSTGGTRAGTAGFGQGVSVWHYLLTQAKALALYLRLSLWPDPLIFDYGRDVVRSFAAVFPHALLIVALLVASTFSLRRHPALGFAGLWFFAILAPTSSIVPIVTEPLAEHRMYLPLAAIVAVAVLGAYAWIGRYGLAVFMVIAPVFGILTVKRNEVYQSHLTLWRDTVSKLPQNGRAHYFLASTLVAEGKPAEALPHFEESVRLQPTEAKAHFSLATALLGFGKTAEAAQHFEKTLLIDPHHLDAHNNYGLLLRQAGRTAEAIQHFRAALQINPDYAPVHNNLGIAFGSSGQLAEAIIHFQNALTARPDYAEAHNNLGYAFRQTGRLDQAVTHFQTAIQLNPRYAEAYNNLAQTWDALGRATEAADAYQEVVRLEPAYLDGRYNLGDAFVRLNRVPEAIAQFEAILRLQPEHRAAQDRLDELRVSTRETTSLSTATDAR
jgi:tetratricopeptide (TPR) repeat protein